MHAAGHCCKLDKVHVASLLHAKRVDDDQLQEEKEFNLGIFTWQRRFLVS